LKIKNKYYQKHKVEENNQIELKKVIKLIIEKNYKITKKGTFIIKN